MSWEIAGDLLTDCREGEMAPKRERESRLPDSSSFLLLFLLLLLLLLKPNSSSAFSSPHAMEIFVSIL